LAPQAQRLAYARQVLDDPVLLADEFVASVQRFSSYENVAENFHPSRPRHTFGPRLKATKDLVLRLHNSKCIHPVDAPDRVRGGAEHPHVRDVPPGELAFEHVDRELLLHRTRSPAQWDDGKSNRGGIRIDIVLATCTERAPVVAELKLPSDMDPFFALVQALTGAAHLATPAQYARLREHLPNGRFPPSNGRPRLDVYTLFVGTTEGSNQPAFRRAAHELPPKLLAHDGLAQSVRRIAGISVGLNPEGEVNADTRFAWERHLEQATR
jgi:hypothetical protein